MAEEEAQLIAAQQASSSPSPVIPPAVPYVPGPAAKVAPAFQPQPFVRPTSPAAGSPFAVRCPYPGCGMPNMEAFMFPQHVVMWHTSAIAHNHACPVCALDAVRRWHLYRLDLHLITLTVSPPFPTECKDKSNAACENYPCRHANCEYPKSNAISSTVPTSAACAATT